MGGKSKLTICITVILGASLILLFVQNRYQVKKAQQAFYGTYAVREPEKRLEALEKFIGDFPDSANVGSAKRELFKATIKIWPDDRGKMLETAERLTGPDEKSGNGDYYNNQFIAKELFTAGVFLDDAEEFAVRSLEAFGKERYIVDLKKQYAEWGKELVDAEQAYRDELAAYRTTLGRIFLIKGRTAEGEKILREAYAVDSTIAQAAIGLAEIEEKRGNDDAALDYLASAALTAGYAMEDARIRLETLYRKTHGSSLDGLDEMLDAAYRKSFPNPVEVEPYRPTEARSKRTVLVENFTGAG